MMAQVNKTEASSSGRTMVGTVVSDKMDKTIVVQVVRTLRDPFWGKVIRRHKKYKVHDEKETSHIGDVVEIKECRPLSKDKYMTLVQILTKKQ